MSLRLRLGWLDPEYEYTDELSRDTEEVGDKYDEGGFGELCGYWLD